MSSVLNLTEGSSIGLSSDPVTKSHNCPENSFVRQIIYNDDVSLNKIVGMNIGCGDSTLTGWSGTAWTGTGSTITDAAGVITNKRIILSNAQNPLNSVYGNVENGYISGLDVSSSGANINSALPMQLNKCGSGQIASGVKSYHNNGLKGIQLSCKNATPTEFVLMYTYLYNSINNGVFNPNFINNMNVALASSDIAIKAVGDDLKLSYDRWSAARQAGLASWVALNGLITDTTKTPLEKHALCLTYIGNLHTAFTAMETEKSAALAINQQYNDVSSQYSRLTAIVSLMNKQLQDYDNTAVTMAIANVGNSNMDLSAAAQAVSNIYEDIVDLVQNVNSIKSSVDQLKQANPNTNISTYFKSVDDAHKSMQSMLSVDLPAAMLIYNNAVIESGSATPGGSTPSGSTPSVNVKSAEPDTMYVKYFGLALWVWILLLVFIVILVMKYKKSDKNISSFDAMFDSFTQ